MRRFVAWWIVVVMVAAICATTGAPAAGQSSERLVLAFYYTWFDEHSWDPTRLPDLPHEPYVSRDRAVMARHIEQAKTAGIDAFVVSWYGPRVENNQTETNFRVMLDEAAARGFRLALDVEVTSPFFGGPADVQAALQALLATHARHPAYLKVDGRPVIFFWRQQRFDLGTWSGIRAATDPGRNSLWIEEGVDVSMLGVFDGHHLYKVIWNPPTDLAYTANKFARLVRNAAANLGMPKIYVATAMPGWDDRKLGRGDSFGIGREDGAVYERSWRAAIGSAPDWVIITSFNEWPEGTYIEPSRAYGNRYLELTARWSAAFKSGAAPTAPAIAAQAVPIVRPTPTPAPIPTPTPSRRGWDARPFDLKRMLLEKWGGAVDLSSPAPGDEGGPK
ncbi:MAG: endo-1,3-alpha-glucanase family glycosylhydrolase [Anaerolineae bacterium]